MANTIHVDVVSLTESIYSGDAEFVVLPGVMGELGIYPQHAPLITQIKPGEVRIKIPGQEEPQIVFAKDIDEAAALAAKQRAEETLQNKTSKEEIAAAEGELAGAVAQLAAIRRLRGRR